MGNDQDPWTKEISLDSTALMFSWKRKEDCEGSKEIKEMEAMIAAMTSTNLTNLANEDGDKVDDEASLEAELVALVGIGNVPRSNQRITRMYKEEDPENVQLETGDEEDPELLEELASLSPHSVDVLADQNIMDEMMETSKTSAISNEIEKDVKTEQQEQELIAFDVKEQRMTNGNVTAKDVIVSSGENHLTEIEPTLSEPARPDEEKKVISVVPDKKAMGEQNAVSKQIAAAKMLALKYKRAGDLEAAKDVLRMMKQLESSGQKTITLPVQKKSLMPDEHVSVKSNHRVMMDRQVAMERLEEQVNKALRASKLYELKRQSALAQAFKQRARTILGEIDKLKKSVETSVQVAEIQISYDVVTPSLKDIKPDELYLGITQIKAEGFGEESCWSFQCTLDSQEKNTSIGTLTPKIYHDVVFVGLVRDLRLQKLFEHRKLKIELLRHEPGFFGSLLGRKGTGQPFGVSAQIKLDSLLKGPSSIETVSFTCKNKRCSLQADISLKVNTPIGSKSIQRIKETWITSKIESEEAAAVTRKSSLPGTLPGAIPVEELISYSVLEEELSRLASLPVQTRSHPAVTTRQLQLESARDLLTLKVQIGELSQEEYAKSIDEAIVRFKRQAVTAKKGGDLALAKSYLEYSKIMEKELVDEDVE